MPSDRFVQQLTDQIGHEFAASQQYVAIAVHFDAMTLPRLAAHFYAQAVEERNHAMMMVQYLLDVDVVPSLPGVAAPQSAFTGIVEPVELALAQEKRVTDQIVALVRTAREDVDPISEQFLQWFLKEQVEEVASMGDLLDVVRRSEQNVMWAEEHLAREAADEGADPTAPPAAGGAL